MSGEMTRYLLDTNVISALIARVPEVRSRFQFHLVQKDSLYICEPVHFEVRRGLIKVDARIKIARFTEEILSQLTWVELMHEDWLLATKYWADMTSKGRQFSDMDLLIAAIAKRLDATLVSSDSDFDALPITREDWRKEEQ
jgi:predicted nucleic acid-binding protein